MRTALAVDVGLSDELGDLPTDHFGIEGIPVAGEEQGGLVGLLGEQRPDFVQVTAQPMQATGTDGNHAFLVPLPSNAHHLLFVVHVGEFQVSEFTSPDPGRVEHFQHGPVPQAESVSDFGNRQNRFDLGAAEGFHRQAVFGSGQLQVCGGIGLDQALLAHPREQVLDGSDSIALSGDAQRLAVGLAVAVEPTLIAFQLRAGHLLRIVDIALLGPGQERAEIVLFSFGATVQRFKVTEPFPRECGECEGIAGST